MPDLRRRFGKLVAAHRRRIGITQEVLAERAALSVDMISKIEIGATGARFPALQRLAEALGVDVAELFTTELPSGHFQRGSLAEITSRLARLNERELVWIRGVIEAALTPKGP